MYFYEKEISSKSQSEIDQYLKEANGHYLKVKQIY